MTKKYHTSENVERVGARFLKVLTSWFKSDGKTPTPDMIEHGNDYYDANMAMDAALRQCGIDPFKGGDLTADMTDLFNAAWARAVEMAKAAQ